MINPFFRTPVIWIFETPETFAAPQDLAQLLTAWSERLVRLPHATEIEAFGVSMAMGVAWGRPKSWMVYRVENPNPTCMIPEISGVPPILGNINFF